MEAQASRKYWSALFGEDFKRDPEGEGPNMLLNYGYSVLRAATARAICSVGLHPSIGLHHHNRYNPFCLADDLMEPYRPAVDAVVFNLIKEKERLAVLDKETKAFIIKTLVEKRFTMGRERRGLFDSLTHSASSLAAAFAGKRRKLLLPE